jgi:hypothetical protein
MVAEDWDVGKMDPGFRRDDDAVDDGAPRLKSSLREHAPHGKIVHFLFFDIVEITAPRVGYPRDGSPWDL